MGKDLAMELLNIKNVDEIWLIARRKDRLEKLEKENKKFRGISLDLMDINSFEVFEDLMRKENPEVCYLVNAAGAGRMGKVEDISYKEHGFVLDINVRALTFMSRICVPYMVPGSHLIQFCSGSAFLPQPEFASYAASKAYVLSFSRALGAELKEKGIVVTAVCPGPVNTEFFEAAGSKVAPSKEKFMVESKAVVRQALKDAHRGKELSVYGLSMKFVHMAGKILPTKWLLFVMGKMMIREE